MEAAVNEVTDRVFASGLVRVRDKPRNDPGWFYGAVKILCPLA